MKKITKIKEEEIRKTHTSEKIVESIALLEQ
jgi:hypothetical protein